MVAKKNKTVKNKKFQKKVSQSAKNKVKAFKLKNNPSDKAKVLIPLILNRIQKITVSAISFIIKSLKDLIKAPFLFINIFYSTIFLIVRRSATYVFSFFKNIITNILNFKEVIFGIFFGIISGGIGAILAVSYIEISSSDEDMFEMSESFNKVKEQVNTIEQRLEASEFELDNSKVMINELKKLEEEISQAQQKYTNLEDNMNNINLTLEKIGNETNNLQSNLSILSKNLESNSKLILSSSKSELSNRLYLAQSLLDRLESGVPYSPQLKALGKEGLDPALLRFATGGAPTLKDLEARLSARAGEQLDADRTKRDNTWRENLRREISKYVKIKPTNISEIKGVTGALLRAENSISKGNLAKAIDEISAVPVEERGPLDAWLTEAIARQNADIAAKNLLAKTTAALQQKID